MICIPKPIVDGGLNLTTWQASEEIKGKYINRGNNIETKTSGVPILERLRSRSRYRSISHNIKIEQSH